VQPVEPDRDGQRHLGYVEEVRRIPVGQAAGGVEFFHASLERGLFARQPPGHGGVEHHGDGMPGFREQPLAVGDPVFARPLVQCILRRHEHGVADHAQQRVGLDPRADAFFCCRREQEPGMRRQVAGDGMTRCHGHDNHRDANHRLEARLAEHQGAAALMALTREASGSSCL
jgi:hypothetical protein